MAKKITPPSNDSGNTDSDSVGKGKGEAVKKKKKVLPTEPEPEESEKKKKKKKKPVPKRKKKKIRRRPIPLPEGEAPKKKRRKKRGRPAKRGRKKGSKNKVRNTYIYIRSLCWKAHKHEYDSYFNEEFLRIVKEVHNQCKAQENDNVCTDEDFLNFFDEIKREFEEEGKERRKKPFIPEDFYREPTEYWEIAEVPFEGLENWVWIHSPLIMPAPHKVQVLDYATTTEERYKGYADWFSYWVDFCNRVHIDNGWHDGSDECRIFFKITDAYVNPEDDTQWFIDVLPCTVDGIIDDFGFEPKRGDGEWTPPEDKPIPPPTPPPVPPVPPFDFEAEKKKAEIEEYKKEKLLERLLKMKEDVREDIKMWKELEDDEKYAESLKEFKDINDQIKALRK